VPPPEPITRRRPPGRYDTPSRATSRTVAVVLAVLLGGFLLAVSWSLYQRYGTEQVPVRVLSFDVQSDERVVVEFEVTPPAGEQVWCYVRARNLPSEEVGRMFVRVPPSPGGGPVRVRHELATTDLAVTGEVPVCRPTAPAAGEPTADAVSP
jgi:hypothetical protein